MEDPIIYGTDGIDTSNYTSRWRSGIASEREFYYIKGDWMSKTGEDITKEEYYEHLKIQAILNGEAIILTF